MYNTETMGGILICNTRLETKNIDRHVKAILFDMRFLIDKNNFLIDENGDVLSSFTKLRDLLNIPESIWKRRIIKVLNKLDAIKKVKVGDEYMLMFNPKYGIKKNFELTELIYNNFMEFIYNNLNNYFINKICDIRLLKKLKDKLDKNKYYIRFMEINPEENYVVIDDICNNSGVYVIYKKSDIIYIGKSKNIKKRIDQHKADKDFDKVKSIIFKNESYIDIYEPYLINKYKPILNRDLIRSEDNFLLPDITLD